MGYKYAVLYAQARNALQLYPTPMELPTNICSVAARSARAKVFYEVSSETGLAPELPVHLYGYQAGNSGDVALDPLMTGWIVPLQTQSAIISFGRKKMVEACYGGAFLTNDYELAETMQPRGFFRWNEDFTDLVRMLLRNLKIFRMKRFDCIDLWDRYLGDSLLKIPGEQIQPWRCIRRARSLAERTAIVEALRAAGLDVGTNYPPLTGHNEWGDTVLNLFVREDYDRTDIQKAAEIIKGVVYGGDRS
jgi:hypothetical protein